MGQTGSIPFVGSAPSAGGIPVERAHHRKETKNAGANRRTAAVGPSPSAAPPADLGLSTPEQRFCLLFEQSLAGIYRTTLDGRFLDCNASMATMLGYASREELMSRHAGELYDSDADRGAFLERLRQTGRLTNAECRLRRKDGSPIYVLENVSLVPGESGAGTVLHGNMIDITERKQAEEALRASERRYRGLAEELRRLASHLHDVRDEERARIARELHDELGQSLTVLHMDLHWLQVRVRGTSEAIGSRISDMAELVSKTLDTVRRICSDLRPAILDDCGLVAAMEWHVRGFTERTGIPCRLALPRPAPTLPTDQALAVFRIFQESLTNVARHAEATAVSVRLAVRRDSMVLAVRDDGVGMSPERDRDPRSLGLVGMRERAISWGGQVRIRRAPAGGTEVVLRMPVKRPTETSETQP